MNSLYFNGERIAGCGNFDIGISQITGLQTVLDNKQNILTFDDVPTENSSDPVMSSGIYSELQKKSNPNLLDNWYFPDPINQRGETEYTSNGYAIDRWSIYQSSDPTGAIPRGSISIENDGMTLSASAYSYIQIIQKMENYSSLGGKQVTASVMMADGTLLYDTFELGNLYEGKILADGVTIISIPSSHFVIRISAQYSKKIKAVKLELGDHQTLARKEGDTWVLNDPPPNKALELAKCQRYYQRSWVGGEITTENRPNDRLTKIAISVSRLESVRFPVRMRAIPTVTIFSVFDGTKNNVANWNTDTNVPALAGNVGQDGFMPTSNSQQFTTGSAYSFQYIADANL